MANFWKERWCCRGFSMENLELTDMEHVMKTGTGRQLELICYWTNLLSDFIGSIKAWRKLAQCDT
jgi:hypothetical protein